MKRYLQCAEQQESASNFSKYCACHEKWISWLILVTHETLFTMRGVTSVIVQTHQILRLPRKMKISWLILVTHETLFTMRGATSVIVQTHQILRLPRKMTLQNFGQISRKQLKRHFQCGTDPTMIRAWNRESATRLATEVSFRAHHEHFLLKNTTFRAPAYIQKLTKCCTCHEK